MLGLKVARSEKTLTFRVWPGGGLGFHELPLTTDASIGYVGWGRWGLYPLTSKSHLLKALPIRPPDELLGMLERRLGR